MRNVQVFMLYLAAIVLLGHNLVPHHHYELLSAKEDHIESKHSHDGHSHHHENDEQKQEEPSAKDPLSHPLHPEAVDTFILKQSANLLECLSIANYIPHELYLTFPLVAGLIPLHYKPDKLLLKTNSYYSCFLLRGPPAFQFS